MGLKAVVEDINTVDEHLRDNYIQRDGKYELAVEVGVEGIKSYIDFAKLNEALRKERNDHTTAKATLSKLGNRPIEEILADLDSIPELKAKQGQVDETKLEEIVSTRLKTQLAPLQREKQTLEQTVQELTGQVQTYVKKENDRLISDEIRKACTAAKMLPEAVEDALIYGSLLFEVTDGRIAVKEGAGFTPGLDAKNWLMDMQEKRPHWWGETTAGGARGGQGGSHASNPWSAEGWNMTEQGRLYVKDKAKAEQLAKQAGTTIGGPRPAKK